MLSKPLVTSVIMVNYQTPDLVISSLNTVCDQKNYLNGGKVIVVDNASSDDSAKKIQAAIKAKNWSSWVTVLHADRNGGFAFGSNIGIKHALSLPQSADYLMLLNPDTLLRQNALEAMVAFMQAQPNAGVVGSRLENKNGNIECSAHQFPSPMSELLDGARLHVLSRMLAKFEVTPKLSNEAHHCDWVSGAAMMIRRSVIDDIGLLDEAYFLYFEEVDFFQRLAKTHWQTWYLPSAVVMHIEGAATGVKVSKRRPQYWFDSRRRYFVKHYGVLGLIGADTLWLLGRFSFKFRRLLKLGAQGRMADVPKFTSDMILGDIKALLNGQVCNIKQEKAVA